MAGSYTSQGTALSKMVGCDDVFFKSDKMNQLNEEIGDLHSSHVKVTAFQSSRSLQHALGLREGRGVKFGTFQGIGRLNRRSEHWPQALSNIACAYATVPPSTPTAGHCRGPTTFATRSAPSRASGGGSSSTACRCRSA